MAIVGASIEVSVFHPSRVSVFVSEKEKEKNVRDKVWTLKYPATYSSKSRFRRSPLGRETGVGVFCGWGDVGKPVPRPEGPGVTSSV